MRRKRTIGVLAAAVLASLALSATPAAATRIPWGAGCTSAAASGLRTSSTCGASLVDGRAIAPPQAPIAVKQIIAAANRIRGRDYVWGGGHTGWATKGYDCSGAVSYALHGAGLLSVTMVSGQLAEWGEAGLGRWVSVFANADHVYMEVAGLRFDTRGDLPGVNGPRWHMGSVDPAGFATRHPAGL